jgi:hypothetical protein
MAGNSLTYENVNSSSSNLPLIKFDEKKYLSNIEQIMAANNLDFVIYPNPTPKRI